MGRPPKDPVLMRMQITGDYEKYLKQFGMTPELPPTAEKNEADLPVNPETGQQMSLETFAGSLSFGLVKIEGIHRQTEGGAVAKFSYFEAEPTQEWKRSAGFLQVITRILLARRNKSREERRNLRELAKELPNFPPDTDLPRFPDQLGTPEQFREEWRNGYIDVAVRVHNRSIQEIFFYSTGLREWEESAPDEEEDLGRL